MNCNATNATTSTTVRVCIGIKTGGVERIPNERDVAGWSVSEGREFPRH